MDSKLKADWVTALRSGDYIQGRNYLLDTGSEINRYCCLGVLGKILSEKYPDQYKFDDQTYSDFYEIKGSHSSCEILPEHILNGSIQAKLAEVNDSGESFIVIADIIENDKDI